MIEKRPLYVQIERELRDDIVSGRISPGERISIDELAGRWNLSSTPVRDAIRMLEWKGFVQVIPRRGIYVVRLDASSFKDLFDVRIALECMAVELACPLIPQAEVADGLERLHEVHRRTEATGDRSHLAGVDTLVHDMVIKHCGNSRLINNIDGLRDVVGWARSYVVRRPRSYESAFPEHLRILQAVGRRDQADAVEAMRVHLKNALSRTLSDA